MVMANDRTEAKRCWNGCNYIATLAITGSSCGKWQKEPGTDGRESAGSWQLQAQGKKQGVKTRGVLLPAIELWIFYLHPVWYAAVQQYLQ